MHASENLKNQDIRFEALFNYASLGIIVVNKNGIIEYYISKLGKCIYTNKKYNHNDFDWA